MFDDADEPWTPEKDKPPWETEQFKDSMERLKQWHDERNERARKEPWDVKRLREWTAHGLTCFLAQGPVCLCGYVVVPETHPWYAFHYEECPQGCGKDHCEHCPEHLIEVHGGITFSHLGHDGWIFGFDTSHFGDFMMIELPDYLFVHEGRIWDEDETVQETERMAEQLAGIV